MTRRTALKYAEECLLAEITRIQGRAPELTGYHQLQTWANVILALKALEKR